LDQDATGHGSLSQELLSLLDVDGPLPRLYVEVARYVELWSGSALNFFADPPYEDFSLWQPGPASTGNALWSCSPPTGYQGYTPACYGSLGSFKPHHSAPLLRGCEHSASFFMSSPLLWWGLVWRGRCAALKYFLARAG